MNARACLLTLALLAPVSTGQSPPSGAEASGTPPALERVVVIGASLSAGFGLPGGLGTEFDLARALELAIDAPASTVTGLGNNFFFGDPITVGAQQVAQARELEPSLVIALDFAFWYGYGMGRGCEDRMARLERGLRELEALDCPLLLGDLPDMRAAAMEPGDHARGKAMIRHEQVPEPECLAQLNRRLAEWAGEREGVLLFSLSSFSQAQRATVALDVRDNRYPPERLPELLQQDRLHPTWPGLVALSIAALDQLERAGAFPAEAVEWRAAVLEQRVWAATAAERDERRRKRWAREGRREARQKERRRAENAAAREAAR